MRRTAGFAVLVGLSAPFAAFAGDCAAPYSSDALLEDMATIEAFLRNGDNDAASGAATGMEGKIGCLNEVLPPMIMSRAYRAIGGGMYVGGNLQRSQQWFSVALVVDPTFDYGVEDLPASHPILSVYDETRRFGSDPPVAIEGSGFIEGTHYLDGKKISAPAAAPGMPHVYQMTDGTNVLPFLIEDNKFPMQVLSTTEDVSSYTDTGGKDKDKGKDADGDGVVDAEADKGKDKGKSTSGTSTNSDGTVTITRVRPPEKTPLMVAGGAVIAGAGGLYYMAKMSSDAFWEAELPEDVDKLQGKTNMLVVMSGAALAVGAGTMTWGVILDGGAPLPAVNVQF